MSINHRSNVPSAGSNRATDVTTACREIDLDPSAGVHSLAAHAAKIGERQDHDIRRRAAGRKPVEGVHKGDRVGHAGIRRIAIGGADGNESRTRREPLCNLLWSTLLGNS